ncbi:Alpha/Beta hydrolase protein [Lineolata rhizophorae]|uniref:Carboxypeptidase n=1 Tax=Lineolata rhizophorae TaxID=578093 RepID=A0A6A6P514_9PEZI|nr:Alpha/Beta hydrolase protein [Lineolata rhizophorae]
MWRTSAFLLALAATSSFAASIPNARRSAKPVGKRQSTIVPQNDNTTSYAVDGTSLPEVDFDVGESYAGLMPISDEEDSPELFFWFFPSENPAAENEITIWLNGGPGCSSLEGLFQENGPVLWQWGTFKPVRNPWSWHNLTNMLYVEQPVGTGFTTGEPTATNEEMAADQFLGFFKNFVDTFGFHERSIYIAGESYAGKYIPYISNAMFDAEDTTYYNLESIMLIDPSLSEDIIQEEIPAVPFVDYWGPLLNLNESFLEDIHDRADACNFTSFIETYLVFPPPGPMPMPEESEECGLWGDILDAEFLINPCFNVYRITDTCPVLWDVLGFPGSFEYTPPGASVYFNRSDVQEAINAPVGATWALCSDGVLDQDTSPETALSVLPGVIEQTNKTIITHGTADYILLAQGSLLAIQNMTWEGEQGFQSEPADPFFVPYHEDQSVASLAGAGVMGTTHTERGLTWIEVNMAGHMLPQFVPSAMYRQLEFLLGRVESVTEDTPFTTLQTQ